MSRVSFFVVLIGVFLVHASNVWIVVHHPSQEEIIKYDTIDHLLEAVVSKSLIIVSHSSIRFSPGDHFINLAVEKALSIIRVSNLSFVVGYPNVSPELVATIRCRSTFGLSFLKVDLLYISGLNFESCGAPSQLDTELSSSINVVLEANLSSGIIFDHVKITQSSGVGIFLTNIVGNLTLSYLVLSDNLLNCYIQYQHIGIPECFDNSDAMSSKANYVHEIKHSNILSGVSCNEIICNSSASGLTVVFQQYHYKIQFLLNDITLIDNTGFGNILINASSCSEVQLLNFTHVKSAFTKEYSSRQGHGLQYHELQCICKPSILRNINITESLFLRSCIYAELHDNLGLAAGVTWTSLNLKNTDISNGSCVAALDSYNIFAVRLDNVKVSDNNGPFSIRALNRLRLQKRVYSIMFSGSCAIKRNKGGISIRGDYVRLLRSTCLKFTENSTTSIHNNVPEDRSGQYGAVMYISDVVVEFFEESYAEFIGNKAPLSGGITAVRSQMWFTDNPELVFIGNTGNYGGAIALYEQSEFVFYNSNASIEFGNNSAQYYGGALYVDDSSYLERISNKFVAPYFSLYCCSPYLNFYNNSAKLGGNAIYGGWIDWVNCRYIFLIEKNISQFLHIESHKGDLSPISSAPTRICQCLSGKPNCSIAASNVTREIYPGGTFQISIVAVGQKLGTVQSTVFAEFSIRSTHVNSSYPRLKRLEKIQIVEQNCTQVNYTPTSLNKEETLKLIVSNQKKLRFLDMTIEELIQKPKYEVQFTDLNIKIKFKPCPFGFLLNKHIHKCVCIPLPQSSSYDVYCKQNFTLLRKGISWVGVYNHSTGFNQSESINENIIFGLCPFDYCKSNETAIDLSMLDKQCNFNRSGILCGGCQVNLSRVFGSSFYCRNCSGTHLLPVMVGFALGGIGLVVVLLVLNLTISIGTINSLIFYANIANAKCKSFFPDEFLHSMLYKFISVVNMGTGAEACFYDGMSTYTLSWVLFVFPCYIWLLSITIIAVSHYSSRISKWLGRNPVQVLATLFLLSYSSLLEITITTSAFAFTRVSSASKDRVQYVWFLDGNVPYMSTKHALLFVATMMLLLFVCIPYTLILLLVQWLQRYSHKWILRWVLKVKPFIDAHTGPYKDKHRYWTGLLLVVRAGIFFLCTLNSWTNNLVNAALVIVVSVCLILYLILIRGVYKSRLLNIIEVAFLFNLCCLSTSCFLDLMFNISSVNISLYVAYLSVGTAFIYTCLVVIYHVYLRIDSTPLGKLIRKIVPSSLICLVKKRFKYQKLIEPVDSDNVSDDDHVSHSSVAIMDRDSLLADD